jgi:DNA-directed RNA polymerase subunit E'/Rpb7
MSADIKTAMSTDIKTAMSANIKTPISADIKTETQMFADVKTSMVSPFIDTTLYTTIPLHPSQLNNNLYSNIKQNLIKMYEKKSYKKYGYISKIYEIMERDNGSLIAENNDALVFYKIKFSCRICHPLENTQIICKVQLASMGGLFLERLPMKIIVSNDTDRVNKDIFSIDAIEKVIRVRKTNEILTTGTYVKVTILNKTIVDKKDTIMVIGKLDDIASKEEIEQLFTQEYSQEKHFIDFDEYIKNID